MVARLKNKVAVITGATSGMGRATAQLFAQEGCKVVLMARRKELGHEVETGINMLGGDALFISGDVTDASDVRRVFERTISKFGKVDILFNNAGIVNTVSPYPDQETEAQWDSVMNVNLKGAFLCTKYAVLGMRKNGTGSIINNSSVLGSKANHSASASYHASKGGLKALTLKSSVVYAKDSIRVNCIEPGAISTEMAGVTWEELENQDVIDQRKGLQPLPKMGHPIDVAYAALFFASDESSFVTGGSLLVDGGQSALYREQTI